MANDRHLSFRLDGAPQIKKALEAADKALSARQQKAALMAGGLVIMNDAKARAPVLTGTLRRSIAMEDGPGDLEINIGTDVDYAPHQEFGTYKMAARPYLRPAFDENIGEVERTIAEALWDLIEGSVK